MYFHNRIPEGSSFLLVIATNIFSRWQMGFSGGKSATCYEGVSKSFEPQAFSPFR